MILSRKWLNEFVDCSAWADHDFSEAMTLSGSKVETFTDLHKNIQNVVAGRIVEMVRHTNSDHMWVCQVDVGGSEPLQIVTGAQNQKVGDMVPVALDGSLLPDGKEIHAGMLRGELSNGMMCSLKELGLTLHDYPYAIEDGLWIMQEDGVKPGDDIAAVIGMDDHVVEFEITPNRPDCLSVIGLAREAAVTFDKPRRPRQRRGHPRPRQHPHRRSGALPALHRAHGAQRQDRAVPGVDARASAQQRRAPDQQHR